MRSVILFIAAVGVVAVLQVSGGAVAAPVDPKIPFTYKNAALVAGTTQAFTFSLFTSSSGGTAVWEETKPLKVSPAKSITTQLGSKVSLTSGVGGPVDFSQQLWVEVSTSSATLKPRTKLAVVPYAMWSGTAESGAPGPPGEMGPAGPAGPPGDSGATGTAGAPGTPGTDGATILNGVGDPTSETGKSGDFFLNTATSRLFGPKTAEGWGGGVSLVGPKGDPGASGDSSGIPVYDSSSQFLGYLVEYDFASKAFSLYLPSMKKLVRLSDYTSDVADYNFTKYYYASTNCTGPHLFVWLYSLVFEVMRFVSPIESLNNRLVTWDGVPRRIVSYQSYYSTLDQACFPSSGDVPVIGLKEVALPFATPVAGPLQLGSPN